jgi:hypothetical protein
MYSVPFLATLSAYVSLASDSIARREIVTREYVQSHIWTNATSYCTHYASARMSQLESLHQAFDDDSTFYTDGLLFSIRDVQKFVSRTGGSDCDQNSSEFAELIKAVSRQGEHGINSRYHQQDAIDRLAKDYISNFGVVYVPDVFDDLTLRKVCSFLTYPVTSGVDYRRKG